MERPEKKSYDLTCLGCGWHKTVADQPRSGFIARWLEGESNLSKCPKCGKKVSHKRSTIFCF